jgi:hypothetical protein
MYSTAQSVITGANHCQDAAGFTTEGWKDDDVNPQGPEPSAANLNDEAT